MNARERNRGLAASEAQQRCSAGGFFIGIGRKQSDLTESNRRPCRPSQEGHGLHRRLVPKRSAVCFYVLWVFSVRYPLLELIN
jgi:hypothetical protein